MRNTDQWRPTKFVLKNNKLTISTKHVYSGSLLISQLVADFYERVVPQYCRGRVADIGCGFVPLYEYCMMYADDVTAIDWAESAHKNNYLDIITDLNKSPIPGADDAAWDTVICSDVLEHIYEPKVLLKEFNRILKPGGYLLANIPFHYWIHEAPHDYHRYTEWALKRYLDEAGFELVEIEKLGGMIAAWIDLTAKGLGGCGFLGRSAARLLQSPFCMFRNRWPVRPFIAFKSNLVPLGYSIVARTRLL